MLDPGCCAPAFSSWGEQGLFFIVVASLYRCRAGTEASMSPGSSLFIGMFRKSPKDMHWRLANEVARIEAKYPNALSS